MADFVIEQKLFVSRNQGNRKDLLWIEYPENAVFISGF